MIARRVFESFSSITLWDLVTISFPAITTISVAGTICFFVCRNISRMVLLTWFLATALPTFLDAIIPNLFLSKPFGREKTVNNFPVRCFLPSARTLSNSYLLVSRSSLQNENSTIFQADRLFLPFRLRLAKIRLPPTVALLCRNP